MNKIKIFLDGADKKQILELAPDPQISGFTTNPSLMKKAGVTHYQSYCKELLPHLQGKPISLEVFADDLNTIESQAREITQWGKEVYVKIPVMTTARISTAPLVKTLAKSGIKLNVTAVFTYEQVWEIAQALRGGPPSILSVFAGRIADTGRDPMPIMHAASEICDVLDPQIELLWASTREAYNFVQAAASGAKIITAPMDLIKKRIQFGRSLIDMSHDTVMTFKKDSDAAGFTLN
jgi:transaldolase